MRIYLLYYSVTKVFRWSWPWRPDVLQLFIRSRHKQMIRIRHTTTLLLMSLTVTASNSSPPPTPIIIIIIIRSSSSSRRRRRRQCEDARRNAEFCSVERRRTNSNEDFANSDTCRRQRGNISQVYSDWRLRRFESRLLRCCRCLS